MFQQPQQRGPLPAYPILPLPLRLRSKSKFSSAVIEVLAERPNDTTKQIELDIKGAKKWESRITSDPHLLDDFAIVLSTLNKDIDALAYNRFITVLAGQIASSLSRGNSQSGGNPVVFVLVGVLLTLCPIIGTDVLELAIKEKAALKAFAILLFFIYRIIVTKPDTFTVNYLNDQHHHLVFTMDEVTKSWFEFFGQWAKNFLPTSGGRHAVNVYTKDQLDRMTYLKLCAIHKKLEETGRITVRTDMKRDKDSLIKRILLKQLAPPKFPKYTSQGLSRMSYAEVKAIHKRFQDAGLITVRKDAKRTCEHLIDRILLAQIKK